MLGARKEEVLEGLRDQLRRVERAAHARQPTVSNEVSSGLSIIDGAEEVPTLPKAALHEIRAAEHRDRPAAQGFLLALLARLEKTKEQDARPILWCEDFASTLDFGALHGPGLKAFGLSPSSIICVRTKGEEELLWAMEEGVRSGALSTVVGAFAPVSSLRQHARGGELDLTASRRLQLAAEATGTSVFLLRAPTEGGASVARTRWVIKSAPSYEHTNQTIIGRPQWQVSLDKCRGGRPGTWIMEWNYASHCFHLVSSLADRPFLSQSTGSGEPHRGTVVSLSDKSGRKDRSAA